jgi:centromere protein I
VLSSSASLQPAPKKRRDFGLVVDQLCSAAAVNGLPSTALEHLLEIITTPSFLDQGTSLRIVKNLFPAEGVSKNAVVRVIGCLGHGESKPSLSTQEALLKWMVLIYDYLTDYKVLSRLYGVLFNYLDMVSLRLVSPLLQLVGRY